MEQQCSARTGCHLLQQLVQSAAVTAALTALKLSL